MHVFFSQSVNLVPQERKMCSRGMTSITKQIYLVAQKSKFSFIVFDIASYSEICLNKSNIFDGPQSSIYWAFDILRKDVFYLPFFCILNGKIDL